MVLPFYVSFICTYNPIVLQTSIFYFLWSCRCLNIQNCSCHDIAEILLKLALNTNQSINQSLDQSYVQNKILLHFMIYQRGDLDNKCLRGRGDLDNKCLRGRGDLDNKCLRGRGDLDNKCLRGRIGRHTFILPPFI